jgi:hypothetical protein
MILIGAIALMLAISRTESSEPGWTFYTPYSAMGPNPAYLAFLQSKAWFEFAILGLSMLTIAQIAFRLLPPRPTWRQLMRQPGWIASLSATLVMSVLTARLGIGWALQQMLRQPGIHFSGFRMDHSVWFLGTSAQAAGAAVAASWLILRLSGRWRGEPGWVDRLGRAIGLGWIAAIPIESALEIATLLL